MNAVVTTGGRIDDERFVRLAGTPLKALAPVRGVTMLERVLAALRGAGATRIAVVGGEAVRAATAGRVERFVDESSSGAQNVLHALRAWPEDGQPLLYATSDLPYADADAVRAFCSSAAPDTLAMPLCEDAEFRRRFPGAPSGFGIDLGGERVVNGGLFLLPPGSCGAVERLASRLFLARKQPWRMATLVSPLMLVRFALRRLRIEELEHLAVRTIGVPARAVRGAPPELAFDVDTVAEYAYACERA